MKNLLFGIIVTCFALSAVMAADEKPHYKSWSEISLIDPDDGYLDLSEFIINAHGFIPVPAIITEPAVGGFGAGIFPVFIEPNTPVERDGKKYPVSPDITMLGGLYTINGTWALAAGRFGTFKDYGLKYKVLGAYADANLNFYTPRDQKVEFNIRAIPLYLYLTKQLNDPRFSLGLDYVYSYINLKPKFENPNIPDNWIHDVTQNLSMIGGVFEFDNRDNTFTPNHGIKINVNARFSDTAWGSASDFQNMEQAAYWYYQLTDSWVTALRLDLQQTFGNTPFYLKPYLDMRGIAAARYQGKYTALAEIEERYDFGKNNRWSVVAFGGLGKAFDDFDAANDAKLVYNFGGGFRYLLVRKLGLRVGVDIAGGPDGPAWYIVFGNGWSRQ